MLLGTLIFLFSKPVFHAITFKHKELSEIKTDTRQTTFDKRNYQKAYMEYRTNAIADNQFFASGKVSLMALPGIV